MSTSIENQASEFITAREWIDDLQPASDSLLADVIEEGQVVSQSIFHGVTIQEAAERAVLEHVAGMSTLPSKRISATVYWPTGAVFGPFPVEVQLSAEAHCLRQGSD